MVQSQPQAWLSSQQLQLAEQYKIEGNYPAAEKILSQLCRDLPEFAGAYHYLGVIYYITDRFMQAAAAFQQAVTLQPNYVDAYYNLALTLTQLKDISMAIAAHEEVLSFSASHPGSLFQLGCIYLQQKKYSAALSFFEKLAQLHPYHFETQANLANCYLQQGDVQRAQEHYEQALALAPEDTDILYNLGVLAMQQSDIQKAIDYYHRVLVIDNDYYAAHNNLSVAYLVLNKRDAALHHFEEVLRLLPQDEAVKHTIAILKQKKNVSASPPAYIKALFDSYASHYDSHLEKTLDYRVPTLIYHAALSHSSVTPQTILDLGCGTGLCAAAFKRQDSPFQCAKITGLDLSQKMLGVAAEKGYYEALHHTDIGLFLQQVSEKYDMVFAGDMFVYQGELATMFKAIALAMNVNGLFLFNIEISEKDNYYLNNTGRFVHNKNYIDQIATEAGFILLDCCRDILRMQNHEPVMGLVYVLKKV